MHSFPRLVVIIIAALKPNSVQIYHIPVADEETVEVIVKNTVV